MKGLITKEVINWKLLDKTKPTFWCEHLTTKTKCHLIVSIQHVFPLANLLFFFFFNNPKKHSYIYV